ncbi:LysR family transcriptional regulator [Pseudoalteromonas rubra]|uniref:LysR family transcriptional regulator n=1 Tax=Pseudoalteromonas rubra TaxID=43658 RepID=A0A5S3X224_9GAMM|nr:LysR family transcriptional regulator [Pseudoalteromonas rubra]TMP38358.1 LysR family transcriptional regulator [Pseudoalteromonas rubra]
MDLKSKTQDIKSFITVADCGSFTQAAILLNTHPAKVSRSVARLEQTLDVTLFIRSTRRVELTEEGLVFLSHARTGLNALSQGEEALNSLKGAPKGKLRVDAASPFLFHQVIPHVEDFARAYPGITLELISNENIVDLIEKKTDVAIRIGKLNDSNLHAKRLGTSTLHLVASPRYLAKHGQPGCEADLNKHILIGFADAPRLNQWCLQEQMTIKPAISASNGEAVRQLALNGNGIALLSRFMIQQDMKNQRLEEVLPGAIMSPNPREEVNAVYYKHSTVSPRVGAFLEFFTQRFAL